MNCLENRNLFAGFWAKEIAEGPRREFIRHLSECSACDRAFRIFVLTAPVLHGDPGPRRKPLSTLGPARADGVVQLGRGRQVERRWALAAAAFAISAAAAATIYIARPPAPTLEDAILQNVGAEADPGVHLTNYDSDLFAPQDSQWAPDWRRGASGLTVPGNDQRSHNGVGG